MIYVQNGGRMKINYDFNKIKITPLLETLKLENISDRDYFSEKFSDRISNSRLGLLKSKGAKAFFNNEKLGFNQSFEFGSNLHALTLEPESYELITGVNKPTAKAGVVADWLYNGEETFPTDDDIKVASIKCAYYKDKLTPKRILEFREKAEPYWKQRYLYELKNPKSEKERIYTDEKSQNLLINCLNSLNENKQIQDLLHPKGLTEDPYVSCETTILIDIKMECPDSEPVIYKFKSKLDNFSIDKEENIITVNDLKTTSKPVKDFKDVVNYYSYNRELAIYSWLLSMCSEKLFNMNKPQIKGNFLTISTIPEYDTIVYPMTKDLYIKGFKEFIYLMKVVYYLNKFKGYEFK